jgi:aminoglycoside 3-N-acetyltransferase
MSIRSKNTQIMEKHMNKSKKTSTRNDIRVPLTPETNVAAEAFSSKRAMETIRGLWETARLMDSKAVRASAEFVAKELREAGLNGVTIEDIPSDGKTSFGGWLMPISWTVTKARLEAIVPGQRKEALADYDEIPQSLALYSPPTPHGEWVEGPVVMAPDAASVWGQLRGAFLLLESGMGTLEINEMAARSGALGVIVCMPNNDPKAARYVNYAVPMDEGRACVPCFSLSPAAGARLKALLQTKPAIHLRARVQAERKAGTMPVVTATLGQGQPEVYLCAHLDEPGAQDNASGVGVAIEALRALQAAPGKPPRRTIRVFFSVEVRGIQAWLNSRNRVPSFLAGLNLDMVGCEPGPETQGLMTLGRSFPGQAHFASYLLEAAARLADKGAGHKACRIQACGVSDALVGLNPAPGHMSLEQKTGPTYHSSADVPATLSRDAIRWAGMAATAFLHAVTRFDNREALGLARRIVRRAADAMRGKPAEAAAIRAQAVAELDSLRRVMAVANLFGDWSKPADLYKAGVRRSTGCWPAVEDLKRLESEIAALPAAPAGTATPPPEKSRAQREAASLVPQVTFRGFLSFEDHVTPAARTELAEVLGLTPGWSTEKWAWLLASRLRGKATVAEVVNELRGQGVVIDMQKAVALARYLVKTGKARLRPILSPADLRRAFRTLGVRRGSILCVHTSLSQFGYIPGGAKTLLTALQDVLGPRGTLCMPTHSLSVLGAEPYDPRHSRSVVGAVSDYFRRQPGVIRSPHPTHSVAAVGPAARALTRLVDRNSAPLARDGFWGKLYDAGGDVLLICPVRSTTILHAGEVWTGVSQPTLITHRKEADGERRVFTQPQAPWHVDHFQTTMIDPLLQQGTMRSTTLGDGTIFLAPARALADISVAVNRTNPMISIGRNGACTCFYCQAVRQGVQKASPVPEEDGKPGKLN